MKVVKELTKKLTKKFNRKYFTVSLICCVALAILILQASRIDAEEILAFNRDPKNYNLKIQILDENKKVTEFMVAVADDKENQIYGLMNLDKMPSEHGMLFVFDDSEVVNMWMKNTKISLDMIFIDEDDKIVNIAHNTQPYSLDIISSNKPVDRVLEINGGLAQKLGIKVGQKISE